MTMTVPRPALDTPIVGIHRSTDMQLTPGIMAGISVHVKLHVADGAGRVTAGEAGDDFGRGIVGREGGGVVVVVGAVVGHFR